MRKTLTLLALVGILALSAIAFGSPPTRHGDTLQKKTTISKTAAKTVTADTSAVAVRDVEARTCEVANIEPLTYSNEMRAVVSTVAVRRQSASPPERLKSGNAESRRNMPTYSKNTITAGAAGFVLKV